mgnify:CR=1 FL=1
MKRTLHMETLQNQIMAKLDLSREIEDGELVELIYQVLEEYAKDIYLPLRMKMEFGRDLFNAFRKLDILQELLEDESNHRDYDQWSWKIFCGKERRDLSV